LDHSGPPRDRVRRKLRSHWLKRVLLAVATAALTINLFTGAPLLALWVGSHVQTTTTLSMVGLVAVVAVLAVIVAILAVLLVWVEAAYKAATGQPQTRRRVPWMRSLRDESEEAYRGRTPLTGFEKVLVVVVLIAVAAFETWFFFFAGSPFGPAP
jgi:hypothetical protein